MRKQLTRLFFLSGFLILGNVLLAQGDAREERELEAAQMWYKLSKITFKKVFDDFMGFKVDVPVFSESIKKWDGKEIEIRGYIVPSQGYEGQTEFFLSAYPYNMCFFCGGAGPETIMEVYTKEEIDYTAEAVIVKGILRLNDSDINRLIYAIEDVELVEF